MSKPIRKPATGLLRLHDITSNRVRDLAHVLEGEIIGDDAAPAVRAKFDGNHDEKYKRPGFRREAFMW